MNRGYFQELAEDLRRQLKDAHESGAEALACRDKALATAREEAGYAEGHLQREAELRRLLRDVVDPGNYERYADPASSTVADPRRGEFLDGLRKLIEYYDLHPDLPTPSSVDLNVFADDRSGPDEEIAQVARLAASIGLTASRKQPNHHFRATMQFSERVGLSVVSCQRTESDWKVGDPLPEWFVREQAIYGQQPATAVAGGPA